MLPSAVALLALGAAVPQLMALVRTRDTNGVSGSSQLLFLSCLAAWTWTARCCPIFPSSSPGPFRC